MAGVKILVGGESQVRGALVDVRGGGGGTPLPVLHGHSSARVMPQVCSSAREEDDEEKEKKKKKEKQQYTFKKRRVCLVECLTWSRNALHRSQLLTYCHSAHLVTISVGPIPTPESSLGVRYSSGSLNCS